MACPSEEDEYNFPTSKVKKTEEGGGLKMAEE